MDGGGHRFVVEPADDGARLDRFLASRLPSMSRAFLQRLTRDGHVLVDDRASRPAQSVRADQVVTLIIPEPEASRFEPEAIALDVLYEDEDLAVLDKPAGMVVHPGAGARSGTLVHALLARSPGWSTIGGAERPGIVHRLDRGTSGVIVAARNDAAHRSLAAQFKDRTVEKTYLALAWGEVRMAHFTVDLAIGRDRMHRKKISARTSKARDAVTDFTIRERMPGATFLEARPRTGRTHQIRVHLKSAGHPIVGDALYGGDRGRGAEGAAIREALRAFPRFALHAWRLVFTHPATGRRLTFEAPLPATFERLLSAFRAGAGSR
ncbi:MAG: RluA family pseudouridine synthase [Acidobacteria bacterium]|nr:RluA family pseudouridine synthase [Acidobacteriota bacterium]